MFFNFIYEDRHIIGSALHDCFDRSLLENLNTVIYKKRIVEIMICFFLSGN